MYRIGRRIWRALPRRLRREAAPLVSRCLQEAAVRGLAPGRSRGRRTGAGVSIVGFFTAGIGLGEGARIHAEALEAAGVDVERVDVTEFLAKSGWTRSADAPMPTGDRVVISHLNPPEMVRYLALTGGRPIQGRVHIGYWAWELPDPPPSWRSAFRLVDQVWAPSRFTADALARIAPTGFSVRATPHPVHLSPAGAADRRRFNLPDADFLVFSALDLRSTLARKNFQGLVRIYRQTLGRSGPSIRFVLKLTSSDQEPEIRAQVEQSLDGLANLTVLEGDLKAAEMSDLVASVDAILAVHRAEGFGLLLAQGMRAAKPVIATGWSGNLEFMRPDGAVLIDYRLIPVVDPQRRYAHSHWADPDLDQALACIHRLAADREKAEALGLRGRDILWEILGGEQWAARVMQDVASAAAAKPCGLTA